MKHHLFWALHFTAVGVLACSTDLTPELELGGDGNAGGAPPAAACGDGVLDSGEACDDGNATAGDGCEAACERVEAGFLCTTAGHACVRDRVESCPSPRTSCAGQCVNTELDPAHCGGCGLACDAGARCVDGECAGVDLACGGGLSCPPGAVCVAGTCVGWCGNGIIESGEQCDEGSSNGTGGCTRECRFGPCGNGLLESSEACDDSNSLPGDGCGAACELESGYVCPTPGEPCVRERTDSCEPGWTLCAGVCVDLAVDVGNCGACGVMCVAGQICVEGACAYPFWCGNYVLEPGEACDDGNVTIGDGCSAACRIEFGFDCVSPGRPCAPTEPCPAGLVSCNLACIDVQTDVSNCGACGAACGTGLICLGGVCTDDVACRDVVCPAGMVCVEGACVDGPRCGDAIVTSPEQCDDGNAVEGDGCASNCMREGAP